MKRNEIMKLSAEELRLEIARLKGWKLIYMNVENPRVWASLNSIGATRKTAIEALQVKSEVLGLNTNWPTDIAAAWELVEEMAKLENVEIANSDKGWCCDLDNFARSIEGEGDIAPLAICRAWLMWNEGA